MIATFVSVFFTIGFSQLWVIVYLGLLIGIFGYIAIPITLNEFINRLENKQIITVNT